MSIPKRRQSRFEQLSERAKNYIINDDWIKFTSLIRDLTPQDVKKLELYYAHLTKDPNNKYKMRDDIKEYWIEIHLKIVREKILSILQHKYPLPPKLTFRDIVKRDISRAWPRKEQIAAKELLKNPKLWPSKYKHPILIKRIQDWGEWLLENYDFIMTSQPVRKIGISFIPPKQGESVLKSISDMIASINNSNAKLLQICEKGPFFGPIPSRSFMRTMPKGCMTTLELWYEIFSKTKGRVAVQMRQKILTDIKRNKRLAKGR